VAHDPGADLPRQRDDPEAVVRVGRLAFEYRQAFAATWSST
jgi:2-oxoglutarate dehydrogenase complex dehydrogenase (E1) component-like enzyme